MNLCFLEFFRISQIPKPAKIINIEWKRKDCASVVVACSETESTRGLVVVKNGFIAFKYLKLAEGKNSKPKKKKDEITKNTLNKNKNIFLVLWLGL